MMNDTVREELQTKIAPAGDSGRLSATRKASLPLPSPPLPAVPPPVKRAEPVVQKVAKDAETPPAVKAPAAPVKTVTADLSVKKTSPTLVGFQSKNPTMPDWRLQLQNSVRQRSGGSPQVGGTDAISAPAGKKQTTNGANALKIESAPEPPPPAHANPRVANALKRIEESRKNFLENDTTNTPAAQKPALSPRAYPFNVVSRFPGAQAERPAPAAPAASPAKPRLISSLRIEKRGLDTNKLPPLPAPASPSVPEKIASDTVEAFESTAKHDRRRIEFKPEPAAEHIAEFEEVFEAEPAELEEADDLAPISMRFGSGLFDLIIGSFATSILLSPLMLSGGTWMSLSGALAFAAALAIVMFVYLTLTVGFTGRTFGMRLFSLEMIDAEENAYPTLHQAAVSASVYLLSIALGGIGFIPVLFNDEKRAAHDILSGTVLIREM
jgi:uncharacterized RDD family membrane protein YckC